MLVMNVGDKFKIKRDDKNNAGNIGARRWWTKMVDVVDKNGHNI